MTMNFDWQNLAALLAVLLAALDIGFRAWRPFKPSERSAGCSHCSGCVTPRARAEPEVVQVTIQSINLPGCDPRLAGQDFNATAL